MRFLALAADFDGTLAHHGRVDEATVAALRRVRLQYSVITLTKRNIDEWILSGDLA